MTTEQESRLRKVGPGVSCKKERGKADDAFLPHIYRVHRKLRRQRLPQRQRRAKGYQDNAANKRGANRNEQSHSGTMTERHIFQNLKD